MQFVYKPEGAEPKRWDFDSGKMMSPEAEAIERHTDMTFGEWEAAFLKGSMRAIHAYLYVMLKRSAPTLKYDEVQFCLAEVDFELDDDEKAQTREGLEAAAVERDLEPAEAALLESLSHEGAEVPKEDPPA